MDKGFSKKIQSEIAAYFAASDSFQNALADILTAEETSSGLREETLKSITDEVRNVYNKLNNSYSSALTDIEIKNQIIQALDIDPSVDVTSLIDDAINDIEKNVSDQIGLKSKTFTAEALSGQDFNKGISKKRRNTFADLANKRSSNLASVKHGDKFTIIDFAGLESKLASEVVFTGHGKDLDPGSGLIAGVKQAMKIKDNEDAVKGNKYFSFLKSYINNNKTILAIDAIDPASSTIIYDLLREIVNDPIKKRDMYIAISADLAGEYTKFLNGDNNGNNVFKLIKKHGIKLIIPDKNTLLQRNRFGDQVRDITSGSFQTKSRLYRMNVKSAITFDGKTGTAFKMFEATDTAFSRFSGAVVEMLNEKYSLLKPNEKGLLAISRSEMLNKFDSLILDKSDIEAVKDLAQANRLIFNRNISQLDIINLVKKSARKELRFISNIKTESIDSLIPEERGGFVKKEFGAPTVKKRSRRAYIMDVTKDISSRVKSALRSEAPEVMLGKLAKVPGIKNPYADDAVGVDYKAKLTRREILSDAFDATPAALDKVNSYLDSEDVIDILLKGISDVASGHDEDAVLTKKIYDRLSGAKLLGKDRFYKELNTGDTRAVFEKLIRENADGILSSMYESVQDMSRLSMQSIGGNLVNKESAAEKFFSWDIEEVIDNALNKKSGVASWHYAQDKQASFLLSGKSFDRINWRPQIEQAAAFLDKRSFPAFKKYVISVYGRNDTLVKLALKRIESIVNNTTRVVGSDAYIEIGRIKDSLKSLSHNDKISFAALKMNEAIDNIRPGGPERALGSLGSLKQIQNTDYFNMLVGSVERYGSRRGIDKDIAAMSLMMSDISKRGFFEPSFYNKARLYNFHGMVNPAILGMMDKGRRAEFVDQFNKMPTNIKLAFIDISGVAGMKKNDRDLIDSIEGVSERHLTPQIKAKLNKMLDLAWAGFKILKQETGLDVMDIRTAELKQAILLGKDKSGALLVEGAVLKNVYSAADYSIKKISLDSLKQRDIFMYDTETFSLHQKKGDIHTFGMSYKTARGKTDSFSISLDPVDTKSSQLLRSVKGGYGKTRVKQVLEVNALLYSDERSSLASFREFLKKLRKESSVLASHNAGFDIDKLTAWLQSIKNPRKLKGLQAEKYRLVSEFMDIVNAKRANPGSFLDSFSIAKMVAKDVPSLSVDNLMKTLFTEAERSAIKKEFVKSSFGSKVKAYVSSIEHTAEYDTFRELKLIERLLQKGAGRNIYKAIDSAGRDVADVFGQITELLDSLAAKGMSDEEMSRMLHKALTSIGSNRFLDPSIPRFESGMNAGDGRVDMRQMRTLGVNKEAMRQIIDSLSKEFGGKERGLFYNASKAGYIFTSGMAKLLVNNTYAGALELNSKIKSVGSIMNKIEFNRTGRIYDDKIKRSRELLKESHRLLDEAKAVRGSEFLLNDGPVARKMESVISWIDDRLTSKGAGKAFKAIGSFFEFVTDTYQLGGLMNLTPLKERIGFIDSNIIRQEFENFVKTDGDGDINKVLKKRKLTAFMNQTFERYADTYKYKGAGVTAYKKAFVNYVLRSGGDFNKALRNLDQPSNVGQLIGQRMDKFISDKEFKSLNKTADAALFRSLNRNGEIPIGFRTRMVVGDVLHGSFNAAWRVGKFAASTGFEALDAYQWYRVTSFWASKAGQAAGKDIITNEEQWYKYSGRGQGEYERDLIYNTAIQAWQVKTSGTYISKGIRFIPTYKKITKEVGFTLNKKIITSAAKAIEKNSETAAREYSEKKLASIAAKRIIRNKAINRAIKSGSYGLLTRAGMRFGVSVVSSEFTAGLSLLMNLATVSDLGLFVYSGLNGNWDDPLQTTDLLSLIPGLGKFGGERVVLLPDVFGNPTPTVVSTFEAKSRKLGYGANFLQGVVGVSAAAFMLKGGGNAKVLKYIDDYEEYSRATKRFMGTNKTYIETDNGKILYKSAVKIMEDMQKADFSSNTLKRRQFSKLVETRNSSISAALDLGLIDKDIASRLRYYNLDSKKINIDKNIDEFYAKLSDPLGIVVDKAVMSGTALSAESTLSLKYVLDNPIIVDELNSLKRVSNKILEVSTGKDRISKSHGEIMNALTREQPLAQLNFENAKLGDEISRIISSGSDEKTIARVLDKIKRTRRSIERTYGNTSRIMLGYEVKTMRNVFNKYGATDMAGRTIDWAMVDPKLASKIKGKSGRDIALSSREIKDLEKALLGKYGIKVGAKWMLTSLWFDPVEKMGEAAELFATDYSNLSEEQKKKKKEILRPLYASLYSGTKNLFTEQDFSEFLTNLDIAETASQPIPSLVLSSYFSSKQLRAMGLKEDIFDLMAEQAPSGAPGAFLGAGVLAINTVASIALVQKLSRYAEDRPFSEMTAMKHIANINGLKNNVLKWLQETGDGRKALRKIAKQNGRSEAQIIKEFSVTFDKISESIVLAKEFLPNSFAYYEKKSTGNAITDRRKSLLSSIQSYTIGTRPEGTTGLAASAFAEAAAVRMGKSFSNDYKAIFGVSALAGMYFASIGSHIQNNKDNRLTTDKAYSEVITSGRIMSEAYTAFMSIDISYLKGEDKGDPSVVLRRAMFGAMVKAHNKKYPDRKFDDTEEGLDRLAKEMRGKYKTGGQARHPLYRGKAPYSFTWVSTELGVTPNEVMPLIEWYTIQASAHNRDAEGAILKLNQDIVTALSKGGNKYVAERLNNSLKYINSIYYKYTKTGSSTTILNDLLNKKARQSGYLNKTDKMLMYRLVDQIYRDGGDDYSLNYKYRGSAFRSDKSTSYGFSPELVKEGSAYSTINVAQSLYAYNEIGAHGAVDYVAISITPKEGASAELRTRQAFISTNIEQARIGFAGLLNTNSQFEKTIRKAALDSGSDETKLTRNDLINLGVTAQATHYITEMNLSLLNTRAQAIPTLLQLSDGDLIDYYLKIFGKSGERTLNQLKGQSLEAQANSIRRQLRGLQVSRNINLELSKQLKDVEAMEKAYKYMGADNYQLLQARRGVETVTTEPPEWFSDEKAYAKFESKKRQLYVTQLGGNLIKVTQPGGNPFIFNIVTEEMYSTQKDTPGLAIQVGKKRSGWGFWNNRDKKIMKLIKYELSAKNKISDSMHKGDIKSSNIVGAWFFGRKNLAGTVNTQGVSSIQFVTKRDKFAATVHDSRELNALEEDKYLTNRKNNYIGAEKKSSLEGDEILKYKSEYRQAINVFEKMQKKKEVKNIENIKRQLETAGLSSEYIEKMTQDYNKFSEASKKTMAYNRLKKGKPDIEAVFKSLQENAEREHDLAERLSNRIAVESREAAALLGRSKNFYKVISMAIVNNEALSLLTNDITKVSSNAADMNRIISVEV